MGQIDADKDMKLKRADECFACRSRSCHVRIYTLDGTFDEIACRDHVRLLESESDARFPGVGKTHTTSTAKLRRVRRFPLELRGKK